MRTAILVLLGLVLAFLFGRIAMPLHGNAAWFAGAALGIAALFASILWLPLVYWRSTSTEVSPREELLERCAHVSMGFVSFLLLAAVLREIAWLALGLASKLGLAPGTTYAIARELSDAAGSKAAIMAAIALFLVGFIQAARGPRVRKVTIDPGMALPEGFRLRIVQVSDLHVGTWIRRDYVEEVARRIEAVGEIDLFVLTGDIGDGEPTRHREDLAPLGRVRAALGRFSVTGNHEGYWSERGWNLEIERLGFRVLDNESATLGKAGVPIAVAGVRDLSPDPALACRGLDDDTLTILLTHQPKHARTARSLPVRVLLAGHTHGGQFVPWSWIIGFFHLHPHGLHREAGLSIYVNAGTGFWGPPVRLGTRSEITLIEIRSAR